MGLFRDPGTSLDQPLGRNPTGVRLVCWMPCLTRGGWRGWKAGPGLQLCILRTHQTCGARVLGMRLAPTSLPSTTGTALESHRRPRPPRALPTPRRLPSPGTNPASLVQGSRTWVCSVGPGRVPGRVGHRRSPPLRTSGTQWLWVTCC